MVDGRTRKVINSPLFSGYRMLEEGRRRSGRFEQAMLIAAANIHAAVTVGAESDTHLTLATNDQVVCEDMMAASRREDEDIG